MSNISLKHLEAFIRIAKDGSFRKAADRLNTTQPNISIRLANLETQIGKSLMDRDAGSIRLTHVGQTLLPKAQAVLEALEGFKIAADNSQLFSGGLRLGVTETIAHSWLSDFLNAFGRKFPNIHIELNVDLSKNLTEALTGGSIDLALQSGPFQRNLSNTLPLGKVPLIWVASPALGISKSFLDSDAITQFPILTHSRLTLPFKQLDQHFSLASKNAKLVPSSSLAACLQMTIKGIGAACLPSAIVTEAVESNLLQKLNYPWVPDPLVFEARYLNSNHIAHHIKEAGVIALEISKNYSI